jgi:hypothetical protein
LAAPVLNGNIAADHGLAVDGAVYLPPLLTIESIKLGGGSERADDQAVAGRPS